jgi:flagellar assembly protein FliH
LSYNSPGRGKVFRNVLFSEEPVVLPEVPLPDVRPGDESLEGGRQIDPYLVAKGKIQDLQRRMEELLEENRELKRQAESLRAESRQERNRLASESRALREEYEKEARRALEEARKEGAERGYEEGLNRARKEALEEVEARYRERFGELEELLCKMARKLEASREELLDAQAPLVVELWRKMLERLLKRETAFDEETALRVFRDLVRRVSDRTKIRVVLNPADRDLFLKREEEYAEIKRAAESFELVADEHIEKGSCLLETNLGVYDARWKSQMERIDREIGELLEEAGGNGTSGG